MKVRRILLISFFILLFIVALPLTTLSFLGSRNSLQEEIGRNLTSDAEMLMEKVDMLMFERMQNLHNWSHLNIIQEARIGDVDKRLSQFLNNLASGYKGMYRNFFYVDAQQRIIAASAPDLIGQQYSHAEDWLNVKVPNGEVFIEQLQLAPPYQNTNLVIRAPVHDNYQDLASTQYIGQLYGLLDMQQLFRLLDHASISSAGQRYILLLDADGRTIATSSNLRNPDYLLKSTFANWKPTKKESLFVHTGEPITPSSVLVGYANSRGYLGFVEMGWSILILQTTDKAFLPTRALLSMFSIVIIVTLLLGMVVAYWISGRLAKPLLKLTQWVREVGVSEQKTLPHVGGTLEIQELEKAFGEVLQKLDTSRQQVIQATKLAVVGEMAAIMAHEVRTPLGILSTSAQWLQSEQGLSPEGKEMTQFILDESARLRKLVTTLLECARPRAPQMWTHNIHHLLAHSVDLLATQAHKKQLIIEQHLQAFNPLLVCDAELMTQIFLNLLLNAIQILPDGGFISIETSSSETEFTIEIADDGPGIADEDTQKLFDPFFTKREGGIGLGLTVTQQIIKAHNGTIFTQKSAWGGACFVLKLPISQE